MIKCRAAYLVEQKKIIADGAEFKTRGTRSQIPENLVMSPNSTPVCKFTTGRDNVIHE